MIGMIHSVTGERVTSRRRAGLECVCLCRYDGLWAEISLEIVIVICGILSAFGQPGESVRAMFIALAVLPSFTYVINITRFVKLWDSHDASHSTDARWEVRFSASGLILLFVVNYLWMFAWGWGNSECMERRQGAFSETLLHGAIDSAV